MKKFMDFSDQVTFVSSSIVGEDFSGNKSFEVTLSDGSKYRIPKNLKSQWNNIKGQPDKDAFAKKHGNSVTSNPQQGGGGGNSLYSQVKNTARDIKEREEYLRGKGLDLDKDEVLKGLRRYNKAATDEFVSGSEVAETQSRINTLKNIQEINRLEKQAKITAEGGRVKHTASSFLQGMTGSKANIDSNGKQRVSKFKSGDKFLPWLSNNKDNLGGVVTDYTKGIAKSVSDTALGLTGYKKSSNVKSIESNLEAFKDKNRRRVSGSIESLTDSIKDSASKVSELQKYYVSSKAKGSSAEKLLKEKLSKAEKAKTESEANLSKARATADINLELSDKFRDKLYRKKVAKLETKLEDARKQDKFDHAKKVIGGVGAGVTVAKTAVSSKARENVIRQEGIEGLQRKQATLAYLLGDRSAETKIAAGKTEGLNLFDKIRAKGFERKLKKNQEQYMKSLQAPQYNGVVYNPQTMTPQQYRRAAGFSEEQVSSLNTILNTDFSEVSEAFEGLNLSWQPEEYKKLNAILNMDFESIDQKVAQSPSDMSENKVAKETDMEPADNSKVEAQAQTDGEVDISTDLGKDYPNPEVVEDLLETSFYQVPEEEKQYQEMIAKGFAEASDDYTNFLESMSEFSDLAY